jgi:hypothetical protein
MFLFCMQIFVEEYNVDFGIGEVGVVFIGVAGDVSNGATNVMFNGVADVMFNGVVGIYVHLGVHDSFVGVTSRSPFDILIGVPYSSYNVYMKFYRLVKDCQLNSWCWFWLCRLRGKCVASYKLWHWWIWKCDGI